jgi:hypothetical protein
VRFKSSFTDLDREQLFGASSEGRISVVGVTLGLSQEASHSRNSIETPVRERKVAPKLQRRRRSNATTVLTDLVFFPSAIACSFAAKRHCSQLS